MTAVDPSLFEIAPSPQDLLDEARAGASLLGGTVAGGGSEEGGAGEPQESPAELGDDALVEFTAAAQSWFDSERTEGVPDSVISVQSMLSTLVGSMTAQATEAMATAVQLSPQDALKLTEF